MTLNPNFRQILTCSAKAEFVVLICRELSFKIWFMMKLLVRTLYFLAVEWCCRAQVKELQSETYLFTLSKVPRVHACCLMGPTSPKPCCSDGWECRGGASAIHPLYTQTEMSRLISLRSDLPLNSSHNPPENTHFYTRPPSHPSAWHHYTSLWNHITCVLFFSWGVYIVVDETEWEM